MADIFPSPQELLNPFPFYKKMRHLDPVAYDDKNSMWGIFGYNDAQTILTDYRNFSSDVQKLANIKKSSQKEQEPQGFRPSLLTSDPPYHSKLRSVIASAFTPKTISKLKPTIEEIGHDMINKIIEKGKMDLISDLAYPLPVTVIAQLVGVPVMDQDLFRNWADQLLGSTTGSSNIPDKNSEHIFKKVQNEMDSYFGNIVGKRKAIPRNDLISNLLNAEIDGNSLSEQEILAFCSLLLLAGHVTTVNLIGNTIRSLLEHPQQFKLLLLQDNKSYPLIPSAIEETLRYRSPVQALFRFAIRDTNIGGRKIQYGQRMIIWIGSANHDESIFHFPEQFDMARNPNAHIAFGHGIHFCLGSTLARLEAQVVLKIILERLHDLRFDDEYKQEALKPLHGVFFHGVNHLPLRFRPSVPIVK
ncbi:MAG: cytochrome P450 [Nitrososphaeraceae archaeon]